MLLIDFSNNKNVVEKYEIQYYCFRQVTLAARFHL